MYMLFKRSGTGFRNVRFRVPGIIPWHSFFTITLL